MESANKSIENLVVKSFEDENLINDQALVTISIEKHSSKTQPYILVNYSTEKEVFSTFSNENKFFGVNTYLLT